MRAAWMTDIHLDFVEDEGFGEFVNELRETNADAFLITGDIAVAGSVVRNLLRMAGELDKEIYFVLGNHDYYYGSIPIIRGQVSELAEFQPLLNWLPARGVIELTEDVGLIGHGGWGDGRFGDFENSAVNLNDYLLIDELSGISPMTRLQRLNDLGDEAADHIRTHLPKALDQFEQVYLLCHVPPSRESCTHEGKMADDNWMPHFSCKAMGDVILEIMPKYPERKLTVLCGHTHDASETQMLPNVSVLSSAATYREPRVARIFEI